jgi:diacylglycerol kinase (ATP)
MSGKVTFIIHGKLKVKEELKKKISGIFQSGFEVSFKETSLSDPAGKLVSEAIAEGMDYLVSVGGDGTMNEVVNGFFNSGTTREIPIGLLPYGSGNDFARTLGADKNLTRLFKAMKNKSTVKSDAGEITFKWFDGSIKKRYYINITDVGIGGMVSKKVNESSKKLGASLTYAKAIIQSFLSFKHKNIKIEANGLKWEGKILSLSMANGRYFGSGMCIAPEADITDGKADIVILGNVSLLDYIKNISRVKKGEKINHPEVSYHKASNCKIYSDEECPIDMDGEFIGYTPLELKMLPLSVTLIKPQ